LPQPRSRNHKIGPNEIARARVKTSLGWYDLFVAAREGLAVASGDLDTRVLRARSDDALARSVVSQAALADGWLLRATYNYWILHPEAFECGEDLPTGVHDHRWDSIVTCWDRDGRVASGGDASSSQVDAW
jgi:hypothetical protein